MQDLHGQDSQLHVNHIFLFQRLIQTSTRSLISLKNSTLRKRENELLNEYQIFSEEWITRGCIEKVAKIRKQQILMMS